MIQPPDGWQESVPDGYALKHTRLMDGTSPAARQWHQQISGWMEEHRYISQETVRIPCSSRGRARICHPLLLGNDFMHISTPYKFIWEFMGLYTKHFKITGRLQMDTFLCMKVKPVDGIISLYLYTYVRDMVGDIVEEFNSGVVTVLKLKKTPMQPGLALEKDDYTDIPDLIMQWWYCSFIAKTQFASMWIFCDTSNHDAITQLARFCASKG
jgi:hypothetical protein